jgi:predicted amidohydrolase
MPHLGVAGLQLALPASGDFDLIEDEIRKVKARMPWIGMVVLSELATFGTGQAGAQPVPGDAEDRYRAIARDTRTWVVNGSMLERTPDGIHNTTSVIAPTGDVVGRYRKVYPWFPYEGVTPGEGYLVFDVPGAGRFGISNCYDMWFPETVRTLIWLGAEVILHPSLTNTIDRGAEQAMARAHAAMNQCYFVDVNAAGEQGVGQSGVYGPGGEVIHAAGPGREIMVAELDFDYVRRVRRSGWHGLGQTLKSFRDAPRNFPPYREGDRSSYLDELGPLEKPPAFEPQAEGGPGAAAAEARNAG